MSKIIAIILGLCSFSISAQIFTGGSGDGYGVTSLIDQDGHFNGGSGDGYELLQIGDREGYYLGGKGSGYIQALLEDSDGHYAGGSGGGYIQIALDDVLGYFTGGNGDGYDAADLLYYLKWTGLLGSKWNEAGNWTENTLPDDGTRVCIPADAKNMPLLNDGTFSVGVGSPGDFVCASLWIQARAAVLAGKTGFVINNSEILIDGSFIFLNQSASAINNNGTIKITSGGILQSDF